MREEETRIVQEAQKPLFDPNVITLSNPPHFWIWKQQQKERPASDILEDHPF
jgi:hypothetical protein